MTGGQGAADGDVDPVDDRQGEPEGEHAVCHVMPEVPRGDHHEPQRGQSQQVKGLPGSGFILGQAARIAHSTVSARRLGPTGGGYRSWSSAFHQARQPTMHISDPG